MVPSPAQVFDVEPEADGRLGGEVFDQHGDALVVRAYREEAHLGRAAGHRGRIAGLARWSDISNGRIAVAIKDLVRGGADRRLEQGLESRSACLQRRWGHRNTRTQETVW